MFSVSTPCVEKRICCLWKKLAHQTSGEKNPLKPQVSMSSMNGGLGFPPTDPPMYWKPGSETYASFGAPHLGNTVVRR